MSCSFNRLVPIYLITTFLCSAASAQCGGINVGGGNCVPPTAPGMPGYNANGSSGPAPNQPRYITQWGAISIDTEVAAAGAVTGRLTEDEAGADAHSECLAKGGKKCPVTLTYDNECAAVAWKPGSTVTSASLTAESAEVRALKKCNTKDAACQVVYSGCSLPRRVD